MTTTDQSYGHFNNVLRENVFICTIETEVLYPAVFCSSGLSNKNQKWSKEDIPRPPTGSICYSA